MGSTKAVWKESLAGFDAPTPLWRDKAPTRRVEPGSARRRSERSGLPENTVSSFAEEHELERRTIACGTWALLLSQYSREDDVVFGFAGEDQSKPVPVRLLLHWEAEVISWLRSIEDARRALEATADGGEARLQSGVPEGQPLFESVLALGESKDVPDAETWPLIVGISPEGRIWAEADAARFDDWTLAQVLEHFELALTAITRNPKDKLAVISLVSEDARAQLLTDWNKPSLDHPGATIPELFAKQVLERSEALAVVSDRGSLTYGELDSRSSQLARYLQRLNVGPDSPVGVCLERTPELIISLLGVLKAGGAYLPLNASYPAERLSFMVEDAGAPLVLTQRSLADRLPAWDARTLVLEDIAESVSREDTSVPSNEATTNSLANIIYTSGSTGTPKGVEVTHRGVHRFLGVNCCIETGPEQTFLQSNSLAFDVSTLDIWAPLLTGGRCALHHESVPTARGIAEVIKRHGVTAMATSTALFNALVDENPRCLEGMRQLCTGGESISVSHIRRAYSALRDIRINNCYGPTECTVIATSYPVPRDIPSEADTLPIGTPVFDTQAYILDERLNLLPVGVVGELCLGGPGLARGYLGRPELTSERFPEHPLGKSEKDEMRLYRTGDLARWLPDGWLEFIGRVDKQVKIRGFRIELGEIEACLMRHPAVKSAVVQAREDQPNTKRLVAYLINEDDQEQPRTGVLREFLSDTLPEFMFPEAFLWMEAFPLNSNGKVDTRRLPAPAAQRPDLDVDFVAPRSDTEQGLCAIVESTLGFSGVGIRDNFFELGGNSLLALKALARIRQELDFDVPVVHFFQQPTIEAVGLLIDEGAQATKLPRVTEKVRSRRIFNGEFSDVAIIAVGGRFPGARNVEQLWKNICEGVDSITHFGPGELDPSLPSDLTSDPSYVHARGILEDVEMFDAAFFGISPKEAEIVDPQQRLLLEVAWEVLEEAGYIADGYPGKIGFFGGTFQTTYLQKHILPRHDLVRRYGEFQASLGSEKDFATTRVAHKLNLTGPVVSVQTACSTSLVATVDAFHSLRTHQCDMALAGGASVTCPPRSGYLYQEGAMLSPDGHTRAFDADGKGTAFNDGVALLLLKRLEDALADGDVVYGVIKGAAINNDGAVKASFTAPSVDGQAEVIRAAQDMAGIDPRTITYVETHGTATPLGDPIEIAALEQAFRRRTNDKGFCAIGSVKSNVGHLVTAAGGVGLIKTALSLHQNKLPPSLHFKTPNPKLDLENSPFYVNAKLTDWPNGETPRRAGVSSFGVGGTNAHVVVEEAKPMEPSGPSRPQKLLLLSARTTSALDAMTERLRDHLEKHPQLDLADAAFTLMVGRRTFAHRRMFVAADAEEATHLLEKKSTAHVMTRELKTKAPPIAFLFPGQGAQYVRMGASLYRDEPTYRAVVDYCSEVLQPVLGRDLRELIFPQEGDEEGATQALRRTEITQPALFVTEYALAQLWMSWGVHPTAMIGHSVGEFVAAALSGVMSLDDALRLVAERGRLMGSQPEGSMLSVRVPAESIVDRLNGQMALASDNGPKLCVLAGPTEQISKLENELTDDGIACRQLHTSHAFHSPMMDDVVEPFADVVRQVTFHKPRIPFVSTVTGTWIRPEEALDPLYWARHLRETVRFREGVATLLAEPSQALLEVGPRATLSTLSRQQAKDPSRLIVASLGDGSEGNVEWTALLQAAGRLWLHGVGLDGQAFHVHEKRRRIKLPTYPFERKRFWIEPVPTQQQDMPQEPQATIPQAATATSIDAPSFPPVALVPPQANALAQGNPPAFASSSAGSYAAMPPESATPAAGVPSMSNSSSGRREVLVSKLRELFEEVSGIELADGDNEVTFLELGLDSLSLTQISLQIQKTFKVKVTFRQLMANQPNFETLADLLEEQMPKDLLPQDQPADAPSAPAAAPQASPPSAVPPAGHPAPPTGFPAPTAPPAAPYAGQWGAPGMAPAVPMMPQSPWGIDPQTMYYMQQWLQQQMAIWMTMQGQIQVPGAPWPAGPPQPQPVAPPIGEPPQPTGATEPSISATDKAKTEKEKTSPSEVKSNVKKAFGAMPRISGGATKEDLSPREKERLEALVRRYNARTKSSKDFTQINRKAVADPRAVTGFRPEIKEIIYPIVVKQSKGAYLWDLDDNKYIDTLNGFGACYFGWQADFISEAVKRQIDTSLTIGPQTPLVAEVAERFRRMTGHERSAFCNTGSEAVLGCMRTARTVTGRSTIAIFTGSYHGIFDEVIVRATKKLRAYPAAPGILPNTAENVLVLDYGTDESLEILRARAHELAAVMVEPIQSRAPEIQPREFLHEIRKITTEAEAAFIFDEVITGFRTGPNGAQGFYGIEADLASYGKVVGGGYPLGVIGGKAKFMDALDGGHWQYGDDSTPTAGVTYFAGTFVRHPLALAAANAVLEALEKEGPGLQERMNDRTASLARSLDGVFQDLDAPLHMKHFSTLWQPYYKEEQPYGDLLFCMLRDRGIHCFYGFPNFLTTAHTDADIENIIKAYRESLIEMQESGFLPEPRRERNVLDANKRSVHGSVYGAPARTLDGLPLE